MYRGNAGISGMICCDDKNRTGLNLEKDCDEHKKMLAQSFLTP